MRKLIYPACLIFCMSAHAEPKLQMTPGVDGGVLSTQITTTELKDSDKKRLSIMGVRMTATADVYAGTVDLSLNRNELGTARSTHSVCFETLFTTEADYKFTIDVGGHQIVMSDHIVIPNNRRTCVQHELYQNVRFPSQGVYSYYAITSGTTMMAGEKRADHRGSISVR